MADAATAPQAAVLPDATSGRTPSTWRERILTVSARWTVVEIGMMAHNAAMMAWLAYTVLTFGDREDQSNPVGALGVVFMVWALGTFVVFGVLTLATRRMGGRAA